MKTIKQSTKGSHKKNGKQDKNSSGTMKIFYVLMLLLIASSSLIRIAGARQHDSQAVETPTVESNPGSGSHTADRIFVFHREDSGASSCEDLGVTSAGNAVYSNCGNGMEKQYALSEIERAQLQTWVKQFQTVNYDHTDKTETGNVATQLYLNGQGSQQASDTDIRQMIDFGLALAAKIAIQP